MCVYIEREREIFQASQRHKVILYHLKPTIVLGLLAVFLAVVPATPLPLPPTGCRCALLSAPIIFHKGI